MRYAWLSLCVMACGRTEPLRFTPEQPDASFEVSLDAGHDAGTDAEIDAGVDAGIDAGPPCTLETHTLSAAGQRPIDVLFVIDNSCSMADDQAALAANAQSFFRTFLTHQLDFHLGVVSTDTTLPADRGRLLSPFITGQTPNVQARFQDMVQLGSDGSGIEKALLSAFSALREPMLSTGNAGFVRANADLAIVFLGDEDDQSRTSTGFFAYDLRKLKGPDVDITVAGILGLVPPPRCDLATISSWRIASFVDEFGNDGLRAYCTDDYARTLERISGHIVEARCTIDLRRPLDLNRPFHVSLNGQHTAWTFEAPSAAVPFGRFTLVPCPPGGGVVSIAYDDECPGG
jgi:hypothetical protein